MRCGCKKNGHYCGPGCQCQNCENVTTEMDFNSDSAAGGVMNTMDTEPEDEVEDEESIEDPSDSVDIEREIV